jgi:hypothetical protein
MKSRESRIQTRESQIQQGPTDPQFETRRGPTDDLTHATENPDEKVEMTVEDETPVEAQAEPAKPTVASPASDKLEMTKEIQDALRTAYLDSGEVRQAPLDLYVVTVDQERITRPQLLDLAKEPSFHYLKPNGNKIELFFRKVESKEEA